VDDLDLYLDEEEEAAEEEGANRTFIIIVAAMGGLLALGICAIIVWAFFGPRMAQERLAENAAIETANAAMLATTEVEAVTPEGLEGETLTAEAQAAVAEATVPTDTPQPTPTKAPTVAATQETPTATPAEVAAEEATATATPRPTATTRPTATPRTSASGESVPTTGIGALGGGVLAVGLLFLLIVVRRMRRPV